MHFSFCIFHFSLILVKWIVRLNKTAVGRHISGQLMRSATSSGANYEEACGAESRADFIHKLQIVLKELRETRYWLRLLKKIDLVPEADPKLSQLLKEAGELSNIMAQSIIIAKQNK
ncbi:MAG: four helix bundle protein [Candidatus Latescibacterota bacterium]